MDFELGALADALRQELRALIAQEVPADFFGAFTSDPADLAVAQRFCHILADHGLLCLAWPEEYGGRGASPWEQTVVREEMWAHHEPRGAQYMGVNWVGPTIMRHGTAEQKARHLPPIAAGDVIWCQGFSEPDAGSDLASLRTTAVRDGAGWVVNGQKIWTSYATMAQWCFLLARTSRGERKQQGLTIFLVPMDAPGIEVRPISSMLGPHHLNEVFFTDVRLTDADVLGSVDEGWSVVQEVLSFERVGIARYARCERLLMLAPEVLGEEWAGLPEELRSRWARMLVHARRARLLAYRVIARQATGDVGPQDSAAYRIAVTRLDQHSADVLGDIVGLARLDGAAGRRYRRAVEDHVRYSVSATVASGSIEIQRVLLARSLTAFAASRAGGERTAGREVAGSRDLGSDAVAFGRVVRDALATAGGDALAVRAEAAPASRASLVEPVLAELGVWDLRPRADGDEAEAAAAACRSAGWWGLPYPVAERLARSADLDADGLVVVGDVRPSAPLAGLEDLRWVAASLDGRRFAAKPQPMTETARAGGYVAPLALDALDDEGARDLALGLVLPVWTLLGMLDRAIALTVHHVHDREQFGQPLASFQGVQFQLTDAEVERAGVEELAKHALWSVQAARPGAIDDAVALRLAAVEAAEVVFRIAHQLHGAIGFCDETTLSWVSRASEPVRRLPFGVAGTRDVLTRRIDARGLAGLFGPARS